MTKEMVVSASSHDTKIAILEDGQVVEVYFEREKQYSLAGSIYKGRVTRILPGMQSAFVNIGLERDAFLYVSDFLEQVEEYDRVGTTGGGDREGRRREEQRSDAPPKPAPIVEETQPVAPAPQATPEAPQELAPEDTEHHTTQGSPSSTPAGPHRSAEEGHGRRERGGRFSRRGRRNRGGRHHGIPESKFARQGGAAPSSEGAPPELRESRDPREPRPEPPTETRPAPVLLPGESLAKYRGVNPPSDAPEAIAPTVQTGAAEPELVRLSHTQDPMESAFVEPAVHETAEEMLPDLLHVGEYQPEATYGFQSEAIAPVAQPSGEPVAQPGGEHDLGSRTEPQSSVWSEPDPERAKEERFLSVEEAVEAVREERMIEDLEEEAAELADSDEVPQWMALEERTEEERVDNDEPDSPESGPAEPEMMADSAEGSDEQEMAEAGDSQELPAEGKPDPDRPPQQAAVRERPSNPRFQQRRGRWQGRRQHRGGERPEGGQRRPRTFQKETAKPLIGDLLKEGQEIIVQVAKEPLGKKGARITSHVALPGRYIVFMPTVDHVGVSRKIASDEERHRLKRIIVEHTKNLSGGFIVRTAGEGASEEDLRQDVQFLVSLWAEIKAKAEKSSAPALLHHDLDLMLRTLRDQLSEDFQTIWVDNEQAYEQIVSLVQKFQPKLIGRVRLYTKDVPLFEETGVQEEINKALRPKVWLKSGGYIVINQTEALVAIDVNTGKFVGKSNRLEDTIVKTNVEAIQEIVRQIRLRDLGGIIIIDFIDMDERRNRQKVMSTIEEAMRADKAPSKILSFNEFGLLAITRKRVRQSLERSLCQPCAYCSGAGLVKSPATVSLEILTEARRNVSELTGKQVTLRVNPEVGKALKARENDVLAALEEITGHGVIIRNDAAVHIENFYFD